MSCLPYGALTGAGTLRSRSGTAGAVSCDVWVRSNLPCCVHLAVGSTKLSPLLAAIQCLQHQIRLSGLKFSSILVAAPLWVGSGLHCGGPGSAGGRATPEPFPALESAPYLQQQDPACLLCTLKSVLTCAGVFDVWIRASLHRQHADGSSAVHPMQTSAVPKTNYLNAGNSFPAYLSASAAGWSSSVFWLRGTPGCSPSLALL